MTAPRAAHRLPDPNLLRHVSPLDWNHIVLTGDSRLELRRRVAHQTCVLSTPT